MFTLSQAIYLAERSKRQGETDKQTPGLRQQTYIQHRLTLWHHTRQAPSKPLENKLKTTPTKPRDLQVKSSHRSSQEASVHSARLFLDPVQRLPSDTELKGRSSDRLTSLKPCHGLPLLILCHGWLTPELDALPLGNLTSL